MMRDRDCLSKIWRTGGNDTENTSQSICVPFGETGLDFWTEWHEVHGEFYVDEITKNYVGESVVKKREEIRNTQILEVENKRFFEK